MSGVHDPDASLADGASNAAILGALTSIYEYALEPEPWPRMLAVLAPLFGSEKGMFTRIDATFPRASVTSSLGLSPPIAEALRMRDLTKDQLWRSMLQLPEGRVFRSSELMPGGTLAGASLFETIAVPGGFEHVLGVILENTALYFSHLSFMRADRDYAPQERAKLALLRPHLSVALQVHQRVANGDAARAESLRSFDRARQPMVVLDRSGYAIYSNNAAGRVLAQGDGLEIRFGRLICASIAAQSEFEHRVRLALSPSRNDEHTGVAQVRVPRRGPGSPFAITIMGVNRPADRAALPEGAGCLLMIHDLDRTSPLPLEQLMRLYSLTPAEARVCDALFRLGAVDETAEELCLTRNTVRSHLKSIYSKFGLTTQAQLMRRLANAVNLSPNAAAGGPAPLD